MATGIMIVVGMFLLLMGILYLGGGMAALGVILLAGGLIRLKRRRSKSKESHFNFDKALEPLSKHTRWNHPTLGPFVLNKDHWVGRIELPAFLVFKYRWDKDAPAKDKHLVHIGETVRAASQPSPAAIALIETLVRNQQDLVQKTIAALWEDIHGRGPDSDMWWHGDIETVQQNLADDYHAPDHYAPLGKQEDFFRVMGLSGVFIHEPPEFERPLIELCFDSAFEIEHGVSVLTDGVAILGSGYNVDVSLFKSSAGDGMCSKND